MKTQNLKLAQVLAHNRAWPMILAGDTPVINDSVVIRASVDERELHQSSDRLWPWMAQLNEKALEGEACYLVIEGLDAVSKEEQVKFMPLLKDKRAGLYKLPANAQILIPVTDKDALSRDMRSVCLLWDVK